MAKRFTLCSFGRVRPEGQLSWSQLVVLSTALVIGEVICNLPVLLSVILSFLLVAEVSPAR